MIFVGLAQLLRLIYKYGYPYVGGEPLSFFFVDHKTKIVIIVTLESSLVYVEMKDKSVHRLTLF